MLVQRVAVGIKEMLGVLSTNSMDGCKTKSRFFCCSIAVANYKTSLRPTVPLIYVLPTKQFPKKIDYNVSR